MKYNGMFFAIFKGPMKKVLTIHYGKEFAKETINKSKKEYKKIILDMPELGKGNPMAFNVLCSLVYVATYIASDKKIELDIFDKMIKATVEKVKFLYTTTDLNTEKMKNKVKKRTQKYIDWYTPENEKEFPESFKVDTENSPIPDSCYSKITRCPINNCAKKLGVTEIMPYICGLDHVMAEYRHGLLYRKQTLASGGKYCDFLLVGNKDDLPKDIIKTYPTKKI